MKGGLHLPLLSFMWFCLSHSLPFACLPPSLILDNFKPHSPTSPQPPQPQLNSANGTTVLPSAQTNSFESCLLLPPPHSPVPGSTGLPSLPVSTARIHLSSSLSLGITNCTRPCHQRFHYGHLQKCSLWSPSFSPASHLHLSSL